MLKFSILVLFSFFAVTTFAETSALFSTTKAIVIIQGKPGDNDAISLFNAMTAQTIDTGSYFEKKVSFKSSTNEPLFTIACKLSKSIAEYGSCTLSVFKSKISVIQPEKQFISLMIQYPDSIEASRAFVLSPTALDGKIFASKDLRFGIYSYPSDHSVHLFFR